MAAAVTWSREREWLVSFWGQQAKDQDGVVSLDYAFLWRDVVF